MFKFVFYLILFIFVQNNFYNVSSYSTGAGTCKIEEMATIGHGSLFGPAKSGTGGYAITVNGKSGSFDVSVGQKGSVKGLLLYAMDSTTKTRTGNFVISDTSNFQPKDCQGDGGVNTITHSNPSIKNLPMKFTWMPTNGAKSNSITFRALVVESKNSWYTLQDVTVNLATGTPSTSTAPNNSSDSSTSNSSSSTTDDGLGSWFKRYLLFVVMIIITTVLYVIGSIVELMLKKQNSKARSFAKTVGGFGIAK